MTLQEQIINSLLDSGRDFYIDARYTGAGNFGSRFKCYHIDTSIQKNYDGTKLLAQLSKDYYEPPNSLRNLNNRYGHLVKVTSFTLEEDKEREVKRILKDGEFTEGWREKELGDFLDELEARKQEQRYSKNHIIEITLDTIHDISIDVDNKLHRIWDERKDKARLAIDRFKQTCSDDDYIDRFNVDNPADFEMYVKNSIKAVGKDVFLSDVIHDNDFRISVIETYLKDENIYKLINTIYAHVNFGLKYKLEKALTPSGTAYYNDFEGLYEQIKLAHNIAYVGNPFIQAKTRKATAGVDSKTNSFARAMLHKMVRVNISPLLVHQKSNKQIVQIVKNKAVEHFNKHKTFDGGIIAYHFFDLCGHYFEISLEELGLVADIAEENLND